MTIRVQAIRGVGCIRGYPYFAWGLYQPRQTRDGRWVWSLIASGPWVRSDKYGRTQFSNAPVVPEARHNRPIA
jgi:hypothetical protein